MSSGDTHPAGAPWRYFGIRLQRARRRAKLDIGTASLFSGLSQDKIKSLEAGKSEPVLDELGGLAGTLGIAPAILAEWKEQNLNYINDQQTEEKIQRSFGIERDLGFDF